MKSLRRFEVRQLKEPSIEDTEKDIEWLCSSFGFLSTRDQGKTAMKILKALIEEAKTEQGLTSDELSARVDPTIGAVIYHLKKLMKAGLVVKLENKYELRMNSLLSTINEIEKDIHATLENIKKIAEQIDQKVGLQNR